MIPIPVSSGKTNRHRLSRGGDRQGNSALHTIALSRMRYHPKTKAYLARQLAAGRTKKDILRMLKRAIAREMFKLLTRQIELEDFSDLRPARQAAGLPLTVVAAAFGTSETEISRLERNLKRDDHLAHKYRQWLADHHPANAA
ncbi:IS110 family transposase [Gordonia malaquae]|uniref:IS110 family transposase n=1 Tax=Gordonia malaquae TaxID=410332 RepID=UPI000B2C48B5|nr:IS110 family transposase [Gordonia malaquae]